MNQPYGRRPPYCARTKFHREAEKKWVSIEREGSMSARDHIYDASGSLKELPNIPDTEAGAEGIG